MAPHNSPMGAEYQRLGEIGDVHCIRTPGTLEQESTTSILGAIICKGW
jgi:hypothetical protein